MIRVYLFGSLLKEKGLPRGCPAEIPLAAPLPLAEVLDRLGLPPEKVQVALVNHRAVPREGLVQPGDRVALFPPEYAFFPDWKDFRF